VLEEEQEKEKEKASRDPLWGPGSNEDDREV